MLEVWPPFPIEIQSPFVGLGVEENIIAALEDPKRVRRISLGRMRSSWEHLVTVMHEPFPELESLTLRIEGPDGCKVDLATTLEFRLIPLPTSTSRLPSISTRFGYFVAILSRLRTLDPDSFKLPRLRPTSTTLQPTQNSPSNASKPFICTYQVSSAAGTSIIFFFWTTHFLRPLTLITPFRLFLMIGATRRRLYRVPDSTTTSSPHFRTSKRHRARLKPIGGAVRCSVLTAEVLHAFIVIPFSSFYLYSRVSPLSLR
jgi:hypothetical protein